MGFEPTTWQVSEMDIAGPLGGSCTTATVSLKLLLFKDSCRLSPTHSFILQPLSSSVCNLEINSLTYVTSPKH
ncbi:unnamed protein product [Schistosoma curassoni]|uniref:Uncharacterized protein n=1 Tax=Schistosoma curassoni TaxID=6186 RepID=A0A183KN55_9TREM|nr:unnamed protein product [Schistosoma curassoni]